VRSFHSSRMSLTSTSDQEAGRGGLGQTFVPSDAPIREESRPEVASQAQADDEKEYVISSMLADTDVEKTRPEAVSVLDAVQEKFSEKRVVDSLDADDRRGLLSSQATVSTQFSRQFSFVAAGAGEVQEMEGEVAMRSAWSLERIKREKERVDAVLVDALRQSDVDERLLDDGAEEPDGAEVVDRAAVQLSSYAMKIASRNVVDNELPLTETAIIAAASVTVNVLNRAVRDQLRQLPTRQSGTKCTKNELQWAAIVVGRQLQRAAAHRKVAGSEQLAWSDKALHATVLLVKDVLSIAVIYVNQGPDAELPSTAYSWSPAAIRAACRIIQDVTEAVVGSLQHPASVDDDAEQDQLVLKEESNARMDVIGQQPSSVGLQPSDMVEIGSNMNLWADDDEADEINDNTNNRAASAAAGRPSSE